jgi:hypothetical protein
MTFRPVAALLVFAAVFVPVASFGAPAGPPVPESVTLPTKVVKGEAAVGTVCLDRVVTEPTEVRLFSGNEFLATVDPSVVVAAGEQCAAFTVQTFDRFPTIETVIISAFLNDTFADAVLAVIPAPGVDLVEVTKADVNKSFTKVTIQATSDEPGAILTAFSAGVELGVLEQKGDRYVGRFDLNQPINNVEVVSSLGGCAQRAVPNGTSSNLC